MSPGGHGQKIVFRIRRYISAESNFQATRIKLISCTSTSRPFRRVPLNGIIASKMAERSFPAAGVYSFRLAATMKARPDLSSRRVGTYWSGWSIRSRIGGGTMTSRGAERGVAAPMVTRIKLGNVALKWSVPSVCHVSEPKRKT